MEPPLALLQRGARMHLASDVPGDALDGDKAPGLFIEADTALLHPDLDTVFANPPEPDGYAQGVITIEHALDEVPVVGMNQVQHKVRVGVILCRGVPRDCG